MNAATWASALNNGLWVAAPQTGALPATLGDQCESFLFDTALSDPLGEQAEPLTQCVAVGSTVF